MVRLYKTVVSRPLPEASVNQFGGWIINETFTNVTDDVSPCEQAQMLQKLLMSKLDEFCPAQSFKLTSQDKPFMNFELKKLHRRKQWVYLKRGKTET